MNPAVDVPAAPIGRGPDDTSRSTSARVIEPWGPLPVNRLRSTPWSLASLRTGGLASARARSPVSASAGTNSERASSTGTEVAGTAGSSAGATSSVRAPPGANAPWSCIWVAAPASVFGDADPFRALRSGPRSALLRPTRLSPSPPPLAAGFERSMSLRSAGAALPPGAGSAGVAEGSPIEMIAVPTATVSPSGTRRAVTVPAYGDGSSTSDFAVSISTTMSLISMTSPSLTRQETISASVSPSPTSGSR